MSLPKYKLHDSLGGVEVEAVVDLSNERTIGVNVPGVSMIVYLPREILTKVREFPTEPPLYSYVLASVNDAGDTAYERVSYGWVSRHEPYTYYTWAALCEEGDPVRLQPMPEIKLPWTVPSREVQSWPHVVVDTGVQDVVLGCLASTVRLTPSLAKGTAHALWTAAEKIERGGI